MVQQALPWVWVVVAVVAGTAAVRARRGPGDLPLPTSLAVGATFAAAAGLLDSSPVAQVACLVVVTLVLAVVFVRWQRLAADDRLPTGVGGNRLAGMEGTVVAPVSGDPATGRVRIGTEVWRATTPDDSHDNRHDNRLDNGHDDGPDDVHDRTPLASGSAVTVVAVRGTVVVVAPAGAADDPAADDPADPRPHRAAPHPESPTTGAP